MNFYCHSIMRGLLRSSIVLLMLTCNFSHACDGKDVNANGSRQESDLEPLVSELLIWIGEQSGYSVEPFLHDLPQVSFCNRDEAIRYEDRTIIMHEPVRGVYDANERKIFLVKPWSSQDLKNVGTLLHELVHYVQYSARHWDCWHETEWEAYKLQEAWLQQHGIDPGFNWTEIFLLSRCSRRDIHL